MKLTELKNLYTASSAQVVIFDRDGNFIDSCDSLIEVSHWKNKNLYLEEPWLGSMATLFREYVPTDDPIYVPAVERCVRAQVRYFDYFVYLHPQDACKWVWLLIDHTQHYLRLREIQQARNELLLQIGQ